jgi:PWWP domain
MTAQCRVPVYEDDGLDKLVNALPPSFTARFGEIVWAQGGVGFGWWPAFIYDPRMTVGNARQLARKHLGRRHLVYFFECHDAPFSCLVDAKLATWDDGFLEDYHMGKTAKASGRARIRLFQQAMQAAALEMGKPVELRMDFNHTDHPQILPSPKFKKPQRRLLTPEQQKRLEYDNSSPKSKPLKRAKVRGFPLLSDVVQLNPEKDQISVQRNLHHAMGVLAAAHIQRATELSEDTELYCKLSKRKCDGRSPSSVGFIKLPSRNKCTFEDARVAIEAQLVPDCLAENLEWRFFVPSLGPMSRKQESTLGSLYKFLRLATCHSTVGDGTLMDPLNIQVVVLDSSDGTEETYTDDSSSSKKSET